MPEEPVIDSGLIAPIFTSLTLLNSIQLSPKLFDTTLEKFTAAFHKMIYDSPTHHYQP